MKNIWDMHIHTNYSDGNLSASELLQYAAKRGLKKLSITDHDCVDFYLDKNAMEMLKDFDYVTGCEFVCSYDNFPIEILGYGIDIENAKKYLDKYGVTENRIERYRSDKVPQVFAKHGIVLEDDPKSIDFSKRCPMVIEKLHELILQNSEAVRFLCAENPNLIKSVSAFLREGLNNPESKIYIEPNKLYPTYDKIIDNIHRLNGLAFLAHPYQYGDKMYSVLDGVKNSVDGVECYHYTAKEKDKSNYLKEFCKDNNLMISGGSDFHIHDENGEDLLNKLDVPAEYFDEIKTRLSIMQAQIEF